MRLRGQVTLCGLLSLSIVARRSMVNVALAPVWVTVEPATCMGHHHKATAGTKLGTMLPCADHDPRWVCTTTTRTTSVMNTPPPELVWHPSHIPPSGAPSWLDELDCDCQSN